MRRSGNWYNGSKRNKKYKDAKVHKSTWIPLYVTQNEYDRTYAGDNIPNQDQVIQGFKFVIDNAQRSKPNREERFAKITDCFPLKSVIH